MNYLDFVVQHILTEGFQRVLVDGFFCHDELLQRVSVDEAESRNVTRRQTEIIQHMRHFCSDVYLDEQDLESHRLCMLHWITCTVKHHSDTRLHGCLRKTYFLFKVPGCSGVVVQETTAELHGGVDEQKKVVVDFIRKNLVSIL